MCFSPEASFTGGLIISSIGIATLNKVHKPSHLLFAGIPLYFGIQQIVEGFLWLSLMYPEYLYAQKFVTYTFLIMAQVLWPIVIPISILFMEEDKKRKKILFVLLAIGTVLSCYYGFCILFYHVTPEIIGYHIQYNIDFPKSMEIFAFSAYIIATITPFFVSSIKKTHLLGLLMFLSCLITGIFFIQYLISVWCFFAAIISGVIFWIMKDSKIKANLVNFSS